MSNHINQLQANQKRKLWLHVGTNKTASSYIQSILVNNENMLREQGYCYPKTGRENAHGHRVHQHLKLALHLLTGVRVGAPQAAQDQKSEDHSFQDIVNELTVEIENYGNVIISSEALQNTELLNGGRLEYLFSFFEEVEIIVYLREHASYLQSWFNSRTRRGVQKESFKDFCNNAHLDYAKKIAFFQGFSKVTATHARPFVKSLMKNNDIFDDFISIVSPRLDPESFSKEESQANASIPSLSVELLLIANSLEIKIMRRGDFIEKISCFFEQIPERPNSNIMTKNLLNAIREENADDVLALSKNAFSKANLGYDFSFSQLKPPKSQDADYEPSLKKEAIIAAAKHLNLSLGDVISETNSKEDLVLGLIKKWNLSC